MAAGHATESYALRLKALLPNTLRDTSVSSDELLPSRSLALLAEAIKRSLILINVAGDSSRGVQSSLVLRFRETIASRTANRSSVIEQDSEISTKFGLMSLTNPASKINSRSNPRKATHSNRSPEGGIGLTSNTHGNETPLLSGDLPTKMEIGRRALQESPQQKDDQLRAAGNALASAYINRPEEVKSQGFLAAWICKLSLAGEEHSVSNEISLFYWIYSFPHRMSPRELQQQSLLQNS